MLPSTTIATLKPLLLHSSHHLLHHLKSTKNPNKTHQNPQFQPILISSITMLKSSSWSCPKCTFLNPPSQSSSCQICLTPFSHPSPSSSSSPLKWACKVCTFLNSYSRSNCEICDTRNSINFQELDSTDPDDDLTGPSSVGSVFFPLRRCNTGRVDDDVGLKETVQIQSGSDQFVDQGIQFGGSRNKRKLQDPDSGLFDFCFFILLFFSLHFKFLSIFYLCIKCFTGDARFVLKLCNRCYSKKKMFSTMIIFVIMTYSVKCLCQVRVYIYLNCIKYCGIYCILHLSSY